MFIRSYFYIFIVLLIAVLIPACRESSAHRESSHWFRKQIAERLQSSEMLGDSLNVAMRKINRRVDELVLLSRDIENISASVYLSNNYFKEMSALHSLTDTDFTEIDSKMQLDEIEVILMQNELDLLNQLILKHDSTGRFLFTAQ